MKLLNTDGIKGHARQLRYLTTLVKNRQYPQALLFSGPGGIGKKLIAERFLGSIFCSSSHSPCLECDICRQIKAGSYPDYMELLKDDKGKIPVGEREKSSPGTVRWFIDKMSRTSISGNYCVIIDGVDTISEVGQNALLKTIEEPPQGASIVLIAESSSLILPTIVSRCLEIKFNTLSQGDIMGIMESLSPGMAGNSLIAALSGGSMGTALYMQGEGALESVFSLCRMIKEYIEDDSDYLNIPNSINDYDNEILLTLLINVFSYMHKELCYSHERLLPAHVYLENEMRVRQIIKILLAVRKGLKNNLNIKNSLKGMIYSFKVNETTGLHGQDSSFPYLINRG